MNLLVTGGCGFIGSNFIKLVLERYGESINQIINVDAITYAANLDNTKEFDNDNKYVFEKVDLCDMDKLCAVFDKYSITHVVHLAAETHVDNSIKDAKNFINSNIVGTYNLLNLAHQNQVVRFHHVSTDEVYGELGDKGKFSETTPYDPQNPYSASKASSDFLVRSYFYTYGFPITISNCSNNYGPNQHKEKFIPTVIDCITHNRKIPLYGEGKNVRDWIYVTDHCEGIWAVLNRGKLGETYCIGAECEKRNIEVIRIICKCLGISPEQTIEFVKDRPGHDYRYAIDNNKICKELKWIPSTSFEEGIRQTIECYYEKC